MFFHNQLTKFHLNMRSLDSRHSTCFQQQALAYSSGKQKQINDFSADWCLLMKTDHFLLATDPDAATPLPQEYNEQK